MQRGELAQRQARRCGERLEIALGLQATEARNRRGVDRDLRVVGAVQILARPLEAELGQVKAQHVVGFVKNSFRLRHGFIPSLAHTDRLCALPRAEDD